MKSLIYSILEKYKIVWSIRGVINCILQKKQFVFAKNDILFYCHDVHRYVDKNGKLYSPLIDVLHENIGVNEAVSCVAPFSKLTSDQCYHDVKNYNYPVLIGVLKRLIYNRSVKLKCVQQDPVIRAYKDIFKTIECRYIVAVQPSIEMCVAANQLGIKIFDIQHGVISGKGYYSLERRRIFSQAGWPYAILCWDSVSKDRAEKESSGNTKVVLTGHPAYVTDEGRLLLNPPTTSNNHESSYSFVILISLTWHDFGQDFDDPQYKILGIPCELVQMIRRMSGVFFRIRLHPVQNRYSQNRIFTELKRLFGDKMNVNYRDYNDCYIGAAFSGCTGHITVASASAIEALQLEIKTLLVEGYAPHRFDLVLDYFKDYIDCNVMEQIHRYRLSSITEDELHQLFHFSEKNKPQNNRGEENRDIFKKVIINSL